MKKETAGQKTKWLIPVIIAAAILVVVGVVLAIFLMPQGQGGTTAGPQSKLYWNVDRNEFLDPADNMSNRPKGSDGLYAIRFSVDGEQVEYKCADKRLVNSIDTFDLMGLVFDNDGLIVDILMPTDIATEVAFEFYVREATDTAVTINSSMAMNGMSQTIELTESVGVYNVDPRAEVIGQKDSCEQMDKITVYGDADGNVTHIFILERAVEAGVYLRTERFWDGTKGMTTRVPDADGIYTIEFAHEGELVNLKCKDEKIVSQVDMNDAPADAMGLLFDEEGYICEVINAATALRGKRMGVRYTVTAIEGNMVTFESIWNGNSDVGNTFTLNMAEDCDIFITETGCGAEFRGQRLDSLEVKDQVNVYTDLDDNIILVYVTIRFVDSELYYNMTRSWNGETTKRKPDENGWYISEVVGNGKHMKVKTKSFELASKVDQHYCLGLKLQGDIILDAYRPECVCGRSSAGIGSYVSAASGLIVTIVPPTDFTNGKNYLMPVDGQVYDVSSAYSTKIGTMTTLREGDKITGYRNIRNELTYSFVTSRYVEGTKIYYNSSRTYDSTLKVSKRTPDESGYYVMEMICEGKTVQVKTKDKKLVDYIDKDVFIALKVSGGIVKDAMLPISTMKYGVVALNNYYIDKVKEDGTIDFYYGSGDKKVTGTSTFKLAKDCVIYNVSNGYVSYKGEKTKLQKDDYVIGYATVDSGEIKQIFVRGRKLKSELYWPVDQQFNSTTNETTRVPGADGYYVFDLLVKGSVKQFKTKDKALASKVDSYSTAFGLALSGDVITQVYPVDAVEGISSSVYGHYDAMEIDGKVDVTHDALSIRGTTIKLVRNQINSSSKGKTGEIKLASNCRVYNVSGVGTYGARIGIGVGDRLVSYTNAEGEVVYCFVLYRNTRKAGAVSYCDHCGKEVWWEPYNSVYGGIDGHYYLTHSQTKTERSVGYSAATLEADSSKKQYEAVIDLNGKTLTSGNRRNFTVYGTLTIMDSVGGGKLVSVDGERSGGNFILSGTEENPAVLNIYGGTFAGSGKDVVQKKGGVIYGTNCEINIYGGKISGGNAQMGPNIYINNGVLNMNSGSNVKGDIYAENNSRVVLDGKVSITDGSQKYGIRLASGALIDVSKMAADSKLRVDATGIFTTERNDIANLLSCFKKMNTKDSITVDGGKALSYEKGKYTEAEILAGMDAWLAENQAAFADENNLPTTCPCCVGEVKWIPITGEEGGQITATENGPKTHFYLTKDITVSGGYCFLRSSIPTCFYLNGKTVTYNGTSSMLHGGSAFMNIFGDGNVVNNGTGVMFNYNGDGRINLYGGTYTQTGSGNMFEDKIVLAPATTHVMVYGGTFNLNPSAVPFANSKVVTLLEGHKFNDNGDGTWTVVEGEPDQPSQPDQPAQPDLPANCECCGAQNVTWTVLNNSAATSQLEATAGAHFILTGDYISNTTYGVIRAAGNDFCVNLNGHTLGNSGTGYVLRLGGNTVNIYGEGNVVNTANGNYMFDFNQNGTLNIYGGTYTHNGTTKGMFEGQAQTYVNIYGGTFNVNPATYTDNEIANVTIADGFESKDNGNGTWTIVEKQTPVGPALPTTCPGCGAENVQWHAITGEEGKQIYPGDAEFPGNHYYLANEITITGGYRFFRAYSGVNSCLYLNGQTLNYNGTGVVFHAGGQTVNICGEGTVTNSGSGNMFDYNGAGRVNICGGTYVQSGTGAMFTDKVCVDGQTTHALISGGTFNCNPSALTFTNRNVVTFAEGLGAADLGGGNWTVTSKTRICSGCNKLVEPEMWEIYTGQHNSADTALAAADGHKHYKLAENYDFGASGYMLYITDGSACFDLAGCQITRRSSTGAGQSPFYNYAGTLNIIDSVGGANVYNGTATGAAAITGSGTVTLGSAAATVNLKGGTFQTTGNTIVIINLEKGGTVNLYEGASIISTATSTRHGVGVRAIGNADNKATFNMYGGVLSVAEGTNTSATQYTGAAISTGRPVASDAASNAEIQILGGVVSGTNVANAVGDCIYIKGGTSLTIGGDAVINGEVYIQNATASVTLSGKPTINAGGSDNAGLVLNGALANIDALEAAAQIQVTGAAGTVLTAASENAAAVAASFAATGDGLTVTNENGQLVIVENLLQAAAMTLKAVLTGLF